MSSLGQHNGNEIRYSMHLSAPKGGAAQMLCDPSGAWVAYEEYARLQAKVERLERAGDLMLKYACANVTYPCYATMAKDWNAAKEGKQS
jgi:hypothetical protein